MLELKHISYSVQEADETLGILKDISLTIDDHKLVAFTGPNGGSKTTLAKIIMGLTPHRADPLEQAGRHPSEHHPAGRTHGISYGFSSLPSSRDSPSGIC